MTRGGWGDGTLTQVSDGKWKLRFPPYLGRGQVTFRAVNKTAAKKEQRRLLGRKYAELTQPASGRTVTFAEFCEEVFGRYKDGHTAKKMRVHTKAAREAFGDVRLSELDYRTLSMWERQERQRVAPWTAHSYVQSVKTVLNEAVRQGLIPVSPAERLKNPLPRPSMIQPFETLDEVRKVAAELPVQWQGLPVFACLTGLRPEEWAALERSDIRGNHIHVNKRFTGGVFKPGTKNGDPERMVPLHPLAAEALRGQPARLDTRLVFPAANGGYLDVNYFNRTYWKPAFENSGVGYRRPKDMRHTYASWQLTGNCNTWTLSKVMGTGVENLERTYGRWIQGSEQVALAATDRFMERQTAAK